MIGTFSINIGQPTESTSYDLTNDIDSVLLSLRDNVNKEVDPKDIRSSILSLYSNTPFKQTVASFSTISYIGIDTLNPSERGFNKKIYFGKRAYSGTYSGTYSASPSYDIMTSDLLNSDVDIFFYNTKVDTISNSKTRVAILSGTNSSIYGSSPYLEAQIVTGVSQSLSFDIVNPTINGATQTTINFNSDFGTVSINDITFPSILDNATASNDRILSWNNGVLSWDDIVFPSTSDIGATGSLLNIYGSPVNLNGYSLEFSDSRECPISIGDIQLGSSFNSTSISDILRRMIYDYLPPLCSISVLPPYSSGYVEVGTSPLITLSYTIEKRSLPTLVTGLSNMIPSSYPGIITNGPSLVTGVANGVIISPVSNGTSSFTITVNDGTTTNSSTTNVFGIYPYFYGFSSLSIMTTAGLSSLIKMVESQSDKEYPITGSGNLYFIYDNSYPPLNSIIDNDSNIITGSFTQSIITLSSPTGLWASKQFKVYKYSGVSQIGPPSVNYQFKY
jgi:hypothetical protein